MLQVLLNGIFKSRQTGLNVLGFFQHEASPVTIDELIECVRDASNKLERGTLDNVFTTLLQTCMESITLNSYKIPRVKSLINWKIIARKLFVFTSRDNKTNLIYFLYLILILFDSFRAEEVSFKGLEFQSRYFVYQMDERTLVKSKLRDDWKSIVLRSLAQFSMHIGLLSSQYCQPWIFLKPIVARERHKSRRHLFWKSV